MCERPVVTHLERPVARKSKTRLVSQFVRRLEIGFPPAVVTSPIIDSMIEYRPPRVEQTTTEPIVGRKRQTFSVELVGYNER